MSGVCRALIGCLGAGGVDAGKLHCHDGAAVGESAPGEPTGTHSKRLANPLLGEANGDWMTGGGIRDERTRIFAIHDRTHFSVARRCAAGAGECPAGKAADRAVKGNSIWREIE